MNANSEQIIRKGLAEGLPLGQIQQQLAEAGEIMTYMQLRLLVDDLGLKLPEKPVEEKKAPIDIKPEAPTGSVSMTADDVVRPGALISGSVTFSDGTTAQWSLDELGRLGLRDAPAGYKPSPEDISEMRAQLRSIIERKGIN
jgi:hypothetical protein